MKGVALGHGHVVLRPDGVKVRCGGPGLCVDCSIDARSRDAARDPDTVARWFHEAYERLAPDFGYRTREASAVPWAEVPEANRDLMVATAAVVLGKLAEVGVVK